MKPLRMKATSSADEAVLRAQHRAQKKSRKRQSRTADSRTHSTAGQRAESLTPPRNPPTKLSEDDWGPDESALPPEQAYKRTRTEDEFYESLADAQAQDQGVGYYEDELYARQVPAYATHYSSAAAAAAGIDPNPATKSTWLSNMDDDEYAEYVRAGMWRAKNKAEVERMERAEKERKEREERERREQEKLRREERERIRKLEERKKRKTKEDEEGAKKRYDEGWRKLQHAVTAPPPSARAKSATPTPGASAEDVAEKLEAEKATAHAAAFPLRFSDFPWPLYPPMAFPPLSWPSVDDITSSAITAFLLPDSLAADKHKNVLRQAVLAYHPDRFERYVLKIPEDKEEVRERVRELGLRVSQVLNDLSKKGSA